MSIIDKNLARTAYSGINYDNILRDIITIIQNDPDFTFDMEDFTSSNAGRMILELYAYVGDQLATRLDWYVNENFLPTATQRENVIKILKLIGYKLGLPVSSSVDITLTPKSDLSGTATLTKYIATPTAPSFYPFSLTAKGLDGSTLNFEALRFNPDTQEFDYKENVVYKNGINNITFWEGTTIVEDFIVETTNNQVFYLTHPNVTKNSIQVYKVIEKDNGNEVEEKKLTYVNSFLDKDAQKSQTDEEKEDIPYTYNLEGNKIMIEFAPISLIPRDTKRPYLGDRIRIFYRIGGGENTNIVKKAINTTIPVESDNEDIVQINFTNLKAATGGENEETNEHAKEYAPLTIRAQDRTVNEEDYEIIGKGYDNVYKIKSYGVKNLSAEEVYNRYGEYIKPLEVWNYVLCKNNGYQDLKNNEYNEFRWITQKFENRFNEKYGFSKGAFNYYLKDISITEESDSNNFKNYFTFSLDPSQYMKAKFAKKKTSSDIKKFINVENIFDDYISYGAGDDKFIIERSFNPQRTSIDLTDYNPTDYISFNIDNITFNNVKLSPAAENTSYVQTNVNELNALKGVVDPQIMFKSYQSPQELATNSESSTGIAYTLRMKMSGPIFENGSLENDVQINIVSESDFDAEFRTKIAEAFNIDSTRISSISISPSNDADSYMTTFSINNSDYTSDLYINFVEITSYPESFEFIEDTIYGGGDYSNIAQNIDDRYIVLKSPNVGEHASITFNYLEDIGDLKFCTGILFGIEEIEKNHTTYGCQRLTLVSGINKFYFENGFFDLRREYNEEGEIINDGNFYINYLNKEDDEIEFGNYAFENFSEDSPQWREPATRVYNTIYNGTDIDYVKSAPIIKFSYDYQDLISIYQDDINEITYNEDSTLKVSDCPKVKIDYAALKPGSLIAIGIDINGILLNPNNDPDIMQANIETFESSNSYQNTNYIIVPYSSLIAELISSINSGLRNIYKTKRLPIFASYTYASFDGKYITISSPTRDATSNVCCRFIETGFEYPDEENEEDDLSEPTEVEIIEYRISTANNDYCLTQKYKKVPKIAVSGFGITTDKASAEKINIGDILIYYNNRYFYVVDIEKVIGNDNQLRIIIGKEGEDPEVNWDNAPDIFYFTDGTLYLQKISDNFPDLDFYTYYIADKRFMEGVYEKYDKPTEEEEIGNYLGKRKILALENVFKQPIINTFDLSGTVYYNSKLYTEDFVRDSVENALRQEFSLDNSNFGVSIKKSQVISVIQNLNCVQWIDLKYVRRSYNYENETGELDNEIDCNFDEILIVSDNYYDETTSVKHGIVFNYMTEN